MPMTNMQNRDKKIPLSNRMQSILAMLQQEKLTHGKIPCVADIGCDHAFVSMACVRDGLAERVIAMDVRKGPLSIAQTHIQEYGFGKSVETRLSNGFEAMEPGEATWAVLAGMGGELMKTILQNGKAHLDAGIGLILQPQSEPQAVRSYLQEERYIITDEDFLQEDGKFYTIIKAMKNTSENEPKQMCKVELKYGPMLLRKENPVFQEYLLEEQHKMQELQNRLSLQDTVSSKRRRKELEEELLLLARAMTWNHG